MSILVTGGLGCIGAWTIKHLLERDEQVVCFDLSTDRQRLDLLISRNDQEKITFVHGDLGDFSQLESVFDLHPIRKIIHLGALQVPMCRANPALGARVNVQGTIHVFEAARRKGINHVVYASSIAVFGPPDAYPPGLLAADAPRLPDTLYGVFKVANEDTARIYWQDHGITSIALRPYTVYGVGRDQGLTSEPTKAMAAAARGLNYDIPFGGRMQFHLASDVARQFIAAAGRPLAGAFSFGLGAPPAAVQEVAELIMNFAPGVTIGTAEDILPFPAGCDPDPLHDAFEEVFETPLAEGVAQTMADFRRLGEFARQSA